MRKNIQLLIIGLFCMQIFTFAQEQPTHEKRYYIGENGNLYWNKYVPFYLFGASDSTGSNITLLRSSNAKKYTNPLFFDTEGVNHIRSKWAVNQKTLKKVNPELEISYDIYRDGTPPVTSALFKGAKKYIRDGVIFWGKNMSVRLSSVDANAGVEGTSYSINKNSYVNYDADISFEKENGYEFKTYSYDNTGNAENPNIYWFVVDTTAPVSSMEVSVDYLGDILSPRSKIDLSSADNVVVGSEPVFQVKGSLANSDFGSGVANIYYRFNEQGFKVYAGTIPMTGLKEGDNVLEFKAKDNVNNKEHDQAYEFFLDKSAPIVTSDVVGDQYQSRGRVYVSERTKIKLTAEDNKAGVEEITYSINGGPIKLYREPFPLPKGTVVQTVEYHATDKVKNSSFGSIDLKMLNKRALNMDVVPPVLSNGYLGRKHTTRDTIFINKNSKIVLKANDALSGVKAIGYKINGGSGFEYNKPFSIEEEGFYEVDYYGTDMVNNRNTAKFYCEVDNTAPRITYVLSSDPIGNMKFKKYEELLDVYPKGINLFLAAADNRIDVAKIYYSINGGKEIEYLTPINLNKQGVVTFKIRALDFLGNESSEEHVIYVDSK